MIPAISPDVSTTLKVEIEKSKPQRVWQRTKAFLLGADWGGGENAATGFTWGITGVVFGTPMLLVSGLSIYYTQYKMLSSNLSDLAQGKIGHKNFRTGKFIPLPNTAANQLLITRQTQFMKVGVILFSLLFLTLFFVTPVTLGVYSSCNVFSFAASNGRYKQVEKLIKMGFKSTQKNIDSAARNKHYATAILLLDNFSGTATTNRADLVDKYNNQLNELREERRKNALAYFNKFSPEDLSENERKEIELLREGKYEQFNIHRLKSTEAIRTAKEILNQQQESE